jgi:hypothetical protein
MPVVFASQKQGVHSADLPVLQEVAGAKAVVWKLF